MGCGCDKKKCGTPQPTPTTKDGCDCDDCDCDDCDKKCDKECDKEEDKE